MSIKGGSYSRFQRALKTRNLAIIRGAAAELPRIPLADALDVCAIVAESEPELFPRAAARWLARFIDASPKVTILDVDRAIDALHELRDRRAGAREQLMALCDQADAR